MPLRMAPLRQRPAICMGYRVDEGFWRRGLFHRFTSTRDRWHARAIAINRQLPGLLVTTEWVLTEVGDAFSQPGARQQFIRLLDLLRKQPDVEIVPSTSDLFRRGTDFFSARPDKEWSLT